MTANVGTTQWTAPEVLGGEKYDDKADVYSLAIMVWELFSGAVPFAELGLSSMQIGMQVCNKQKRPEPARPESMSEAISELVHKAWAHSPDERPPAAQVAHELGQFLAQAVLVEQDKAMDAKLCVICLAEERTHLVAPCGHKAYCQKCVERCQVCALCRSAVESRTRVFD